MRLIDADAEIAKLKSRIEYEKQEIEIYHNSEDTYAKYVCNAAKGRISLLQQKINFLEKCKTAYDVDKIVEQLVVFNSRLMMKWRVKMNREISFKAKRTDNGEWVSGDLITTPFIRNETQENIPYILDITKADYDCFGDFSEGNGIFEVAPSTVCQSTGLTDKNGKEIWENDIVRRTDLHKTTEPSIGIIQYDTANTAYLVHWVDVVRYSPTYPWKDKIEVIGNIFENPEILKRPTEE